MNSFETFQRLHHNKEPLLIGNAWDVASAKIFEHNGFKAVATSSAALANAMGYEDGEKIPFELLLQVVERIHSNIHVPLSVDMESGFGNNPPGIIENIEKLYDIGVVGINIEDSLRNDTGKLQQTDDFQKTLSFIVNHLRQKNMNVFINARTDTFLHKLPNALPETLSRVKAYSSAGADGIFVPFIINKNEIKEVVEATDLPLNVLCAPGLPSIPELKGLGVKRISMGSTMFRALNKSFEDILHEIARNQSFESLF